MRRVILVMGLVVLAGCDRAPSRRIDIPPADVAAPVVAARPVAPAPTLASRQLAVRTPRRPAAAPIAVALERSSPVADRAREITFLPFAPAPRRPVLATGEGDPWRGRADARATATIFGDVQCPFTGKAVAALKALQDRVGRDRLRLVWKNYPLDFHRRARPAAEAAATVAMLAGGERAFTVLEAALSGAIDDASLEEAARTAGAPIDTYRFVLTEARGDVSAKVDADIEMASALGVHAVPHVLLGTREIRGAASEAEYEAAFEDATTENVR